MNIAEYVSNIAPYLEEGCSLHEACLYGVVPYTTVKDYYDKDEEVRKNIERLQNMPILKARKSVNAAIPENGDLALRFLERKRKEEFSTKTDIANTHQFLQMPSVKINGVEHEFMVGDPVGEKK